MGDIIKVQFNKLSDCWDLIVQDYMAAAETHGLYPILAKKYGVSPTALRQKASQCNLKEQRDQLKNNLPIRKQLRKDLAKALSEATVANIAPLGEFLAAKADEYQRRVADRIVKIEGNLDEFIETNPSDFDKALRASAEVDKQARQLFGMTSSEEIDPMKRGIAMLAYNILPPMKEAKAVELDA